MAELANLSDQLEERAEQLADLIPDDPADALGTQESTAPVADDDQGEAQEGDVEVQAQTDEVSDTEGESSPAIAPPDGLTDDERQAWASLPPEAQKIIARRERDRTVELRRGQDTVANEKKAIEQERLRYAQAIDQFVQLSQTIDPVLAEGVKTDWVKLSQDSPAEAQTKWHEYQRRLQTVNHAIQQQQQVMTQQRDEYVAREFKALTEKVPEWSDKAKAREGLTALQKHASEYGISSDEVAGITDHRQYLVLRDAMRYREMVAAQKTVNQRKVATVPKVVKPGAARDARADQQEGVRAKLKQIGGMRDDHDKAARIAALIE